TVAPNIVTPTELGPSTLGDVSILPPALCRPAGELGCIALVVLVDDDLMHVGIRRRSHTWSIAPGTVSGRRVRGCLAPDRHGTPGASSRIVQLVDERDHPNAAARRHDG